MNSTIINLEDPAVIEERNNRKLTADKIKQILSKVKNNPTSSAKRWVWELMQNAKDVPNSKYNGISIQIELNEDILKFKHNGDPFRLTDIFSLIQQVSSKDSTNQDEKVTGKFGTGFIATHLLSDIIDVDGYVHYRGEYKKFKIKLDRAGDTSEELLPKITKALDHIREIEDNDTFPVEYGYENNRTEFSFDTCFTYKLTSDEKRKAAINGLNDLVNTLPLTLVNIPTIKGVQVFNNINQTIDTYTCEVNKVDTNVNKVSVSTKKQDNTITQNFVTFSTDNITLTTEVGSFDTLEIKEHDANVPFLFRDFPLIGSEKFHFPFILNGYGFNPTEDRDAILLHALEGKEAIVNREIIEEAFITAQKFSTWLIDHNAKNRFALVNTRMPNEKWEDFSKVWYKRLQTNIRSFLLKQRLVETDLHTFEVLSESKIPVYGSSSETKQHFHQLVKDFVGLKKVPASKYSLKWIEALGPKDERSTWEINVEYSLINFLQELEKIGNYSELETKLTTGVNAIDWLNSIYSFLIKNNETEAFRSYAIIPNINGTFEKLNDHLYFEDINNQIPDEFISILKKLGKDWNKNIVKRGVVIEGIQKVKKSIKDINNEINTILKEERKGNFGMINVFMQKSNSLEILHDILKIQLPIINGFKSNLFEKGCEILHLEKSIIKVNHSSGFNFIPAMELFVKKINECITDSNNINGLSSRLNISETETLTWLNNYLVLLSEKTSFKNILETEGNIIPNRKEEFIAFKDAESYGSNDTPLDDNLIEILQRLDNNEDWNSTLLLDGISIVLHKSKKFEELGDTIVRVVNEIEVAKVSNPEVIFEHKDALLDLIDWVNKNEDHASRFLSKVKSNSTKLFFELTVNGDSNIDIQSIKLLQKEGNKEILEIINESDICTNKVIELMTIVDNSNIDEILKQATEIKEENDNFKKLLSIGTEVESVFKEALNELGGNYTVIHSGLGSFDLKIVNNKNNKDYSIEVKSYKNGSNYPFRFAESQVNRAINNDANFAICTFERPNNENITRDNIISGIKFKKETANLFIEGKDDKQILDKVLKRGNIHAEILGSVRVQVSKSKLKENAGDFDQLISDIIVVTA